VNETELAARIANPAVFAAADDLVEAVARAFPKASPPSSAPTHSSHGAIVADISDPAKRAALIQRASVVDMLEQGYSPSQVARLHDLEVRQVDRFVA
jgi:hypothetical protein